jgi:hypothetical protein
MFLLLRVFLKRVKSSSCCAPVDLSVKTIKYSWYFGMIKAQMDLPTRTLSCIRCTTGKGDLSKLGR